MSSAPPPNAPAAASYRLHKPRLRRLADRAARHYDRAAWLPRQVATALVEHLQPVRMQPSRILDAGAGTGICSRLLSRLYPSAWVISLDSSMGMLTSGRGPWPRWLSRRSAACGDAECLPLADASIDLVVSSLMLPSCPLPDRALAEFHRVLAPGGLLMLSSLGPDTLWELRESWSAVDKDTVHVHAFFDMHDLGDALLRAGFQDVVMDAERLTGNYPSLQALTMELKSLGTTNAARGSRKGLSTPGHFEQAAQAYEAFRNGQHLAASFEVVYGHAWRAPLHRLEVQPPSMAADRNSSRL